MAEVLVPESLRAELVIYAREALPEEACGFLLGTQDSRPAARDSFQITAVRPARNLHPSRADRFLIDPLEYAKVEAYCRKRAQDGLRVLGFWHSHPQTPPQPSRLDLEEAAGLQHSFPRRYLYLILALRDPETPEFACWRLDGAGTQFEAVALSTAPH